MKIQQQINLKSYNTFGIDATAKEFLKVCTKEEAVKLFTSGSVSSKKRLILGGGSNILLTQDFDGIVIKNEIKGIECIKENSEHIWLQVGAGENWHSFVVHCVENNYAGIENLSLIPGNVGASPMQNIGAYGVEVKEVISEVEAIEIKSGKVVSFTNEACKFDYRSSIFKTTHKDQYFISSVTFRLNKRPNFKTAYGAIQSQLAANGFKNDTLSIKAISDAVIAIRQSKLPDPSKIGNSGSFFKNPIVSNDQYQTLKRKYEEMPAYELGDGSYKLAAGWLIEKAGWKGYKNKDAGVHDKQALVLVNYGNASGKEIFSLSSSILQSVKDHFNVDLEREVNII